MTRSRSFSRTAIAGAVGSLAIVTPVGFASAGPDTVEATYDEPVLDQWIYPFNLTPGQRTWSSLFGAFGNPNFDNRDGIMLIGFDTFNDIEPNLGPDAYTITSAVVTIQYDGQSNFLYDASVDPVEVYLPEDDPNFAPDADPGTPIELFGAGFRNGFTAESFEEGDPYGIWPGWGIRNVYPLSFDETGSAIDVSNNVRGFLDPETEVGPFDPKVWAVGQADLEPGADVPTNTVFTFTIDIDDPDIQQHLRESLDAGILRLVITSLHEVGMQTGSFPTIYNKENPLVQVGAADAAQLDLSVQINTDSNPADIDGDGAVGVSDLLALLAAWGTCDDCPEDINDDGFVNVADLLDLLGAWG